VAIRHLLGSLKVNRFFREAARPSAPAPTQVAPEPPVWVGYHHYQTDAVVGQYCDAHYGPERCGLSNFSARLVQHSLVGHSGQPRLRALDLGCAVGRSSFELARHFDRVCAVDLSSRFIASARRLQQRGRLAYQLTEEGELVSDQLVRLADLGLEQHAGRVDFVQRNVLHLDDTFRDFDLVLLANLIDRLPRPRRFLAGLHQRLVTGGTLAIASPYNWLEEFTPRKRWLGGRFRAGVPLTSLQSMTRILARHFERIGDPQDMPFVLRENARKYQYYVAQLTLWRRTGH
jgi:putative 4-mercaptohistidine N1-methyltranferase